MFDANLYRTSVTLPVSKNPAQTEVVQFSVIDAGSRHALETMVFVHGFGGRAQYWSHQLEHFQDSYRVIAPDLRGHGLSDAPASGFSVADLTDDLERILQAVGVPSELILVSHSFGGAVCSEFIRRHPERVVKWVVIGLPVKFRLRWTGKAVLRLPVPVLSAVRRLFSKGNQYPRSHVVHAQNREALSVWEGYEVLARINTPAIIIRGEYDFLFDSHYFAKVAELMPHAQEVVIPVSAHQVMNERPDAVNRAMDKFLGGIDWKTDHTRRRARQKELEQSRPWIKWYDSRTPPEIRPPKGPISRYLEIAAKRFPKKTAVVFYRRRITYRQLDKMSNRFANGLLRQRLRTGERVLIALPNTPQAVIAYYGVIKAGGVAVFADIAQMNSAQILDKANQVGAKILITLSSHYKNLLHLPENTSVQRVVFTTYREFMSWFDWAHFTLTRHYKEGHEMPWVRTFTNYKIRKKVRWFYELMAASSNPPAIETSVNSLALLQYSSGSSTGTARIAALTHRNLAYNALQMRHWMPEARPGDERILTVLPFAYTHGMISTLNLAPLLGASLVLARRFEPLRVAKSIRKHKPTIFPIDPEMYQSLAYLPSIRKFGIAGIRVCTSTGAPLPLEVQESFEKLTRGRVVEMYGLAEAGATHATPLSANRRYASMGVPLPDTDAKIMRMDDEREQTVGEVGELWIKGPQLMQGYWNTDTQSVDASALRDGWLVTGDMAWRDEDGFFYFVDQTSHRITASDNVIYARDIEEILHEHPAVTEVLVMPAVDAVDGAVSQTGALVAFVVLQSGYRIHSNTDAELIAWSAPRLPAFVKIERVFLRSRLPRTAAGKIDRVQLQQYMRFKMLGH